MMIADRERDPEPNAPGYGDQGPAGAGRKPDEEDKAAEIEDEPEPVNDLGG